MTERIFRSVERLTKPDAVKTKLRELYQTCGFGDEAERLKNCCQKFGVDRTASHVVRYFPTERCRLPLCPECAFYRSKRAVRRLFPKVLEFARLHESDRAVMITLTLKNSSAKLIDIHRFFKASFRKLRRMKRWNHHIRGGIASFELTVSKMGEWHYHAHLFAFRKSHERYEQADLCEDWEAATGGVGKIVDIRQIRRMRDGFREVVKYSFKPLDLMKNRFDAEMLRQFYELSKRSRLAESFGKFYGFSFDDGGDGEGEPVEPVLRPGDVCPCCGETVFFELMRRESLIELQMSILERHIVGFR